MSEDAKLFVGNLSWDATDEDLNKIFSEAGTVESVNIIRYPDGRSKGFGFVEMSKTAEAENAVEKLNGKELMGRPLRIDRARPRTEQ
jgi:RNA recognition motif-containing protein